LSPRSFKKPVSALWGLSETLAGPCDLTAAHPRGCGSGPREVTPSFRVSEESSSALLVSRSPACRSAASRCFRLPRAHGVVSTFVRPPYAPLGDLRASTGHLPKIHRWRGACRLARTRGTSTGGQLTPLGSLPLQRLRNRGSASRGLATPATVRPQRFARSRRFTPPETVRAYFIPVTLMGFGLQGFSLAKSTGFFRSRSSLAVPSKPAGEGQSGERLQRFDPSANPYHEEGG